VEQLEGAGQEGHDQVVVVHRELELHLAIVAR
jgi:hypothetical protein